MNKLIWGVMVVLAVAVGVYFFSGSGTGPAPLTQTPANVDYAASASGNPDDIVNAYLQQADAEMALLLSEFNDTAALDTDSSALDGLGQAYNENQL